MLLLDIGLVVTITDLVLKEEKVYVPKNEALKMEIIWLHHDTLVMATTRHKVQ